MGIATDLSEREVIDRELAVSLKIYKQSNKVRGDGME